MLKRRGRKTRTRITRLARSGAVVLWLGLALAACQPRTHSLPDYHGDPRVRASIVRVEHLDSYSAVSLRLLIWFAGPGAPVPISDSVDLYRITYWSQSGGRPVLVSGLLSLPATGSLRGTVLWMHGTQNDRTYSESRPTLTESVPISGAFAGNGYALVAPDLVGMGVSKDVQTYFCNPSTIDVTLDFLRAAQRVAQDLGRTWNPNLYIVGFSQGGHSTAVIQRAIEADAQAPWRVKAAAGIAGPYNLTAIAIPFALKGGSTADSIYLSMWMLSYANFYHLPLESALKPQYASLAPHLFDGTHSRDDMDAGLPRDPKLLFRPEFLTSLESGKGNWFLDTARRNEPLDWAPKAPFRAYYGDNDVDVSPADAKMFAKAMAARGGNVTAISVGPYDHGGSVLQALPRIRAWFDEVSTSRQ